MSLSLQPLPQILFLSINCLKIITKWHFQNLVVLFREANHEGPKVERLFSIQIPSSPCRFFPIVSCNSASSNNHAWHKCLGHPNNNVLRDLLNYGVLGNEKLSCLRSVQFDWDYCKLGKNKTLPFFDSFIHLMHLKLLI